MRDGLPKRRHFRWRPDYQPAGLSRRPVRRLRPLHPHLPRPGDLRADLTYSSNTALVSFPYEFLPLPKKGDVVEGVNRAGEGICAAKVVRVQQPQSFDHTAVVTVEVAKELAMELRSMKRLPRVS